jgi:hypothetical protein
VDAAAVAIKEMRNASATTLHIAHPHPVAWSAIAEPLSKILNVPLVPYDEWLDALASEDAVSEEDVRSNPAILLLDFFLSGAAAIASFDTPEVLALPRLSIARAKESSDILSSGEVRSVGAGEVGKWLAYWRSSGFLAI